MIDQSLWRALDVPRFGANDLPDRVDAVSAGITGLTADTDAWLTDLAKQFGRDAARLGRGTSRMRGQRHGDRFHRSDRQCARSDPYYFLRIHEWNGQRYAIFGGEDYKTGQETDTESRYARLEQALLTLIPSARVAWSTPRWGAVITSPARGQRRRFLRAKCYIGVMWYLRTLCSSPVFLRQQYFSSVAVRS